MTVLIGPVCILPGGPETVLKEQQKRGRTAGASSHLCKLTLSSFIVRNFGAGRQEYFNDFPVAATYGQGQR